METYDRKKEITKDKSNPKLRKEKKGSIEASMESRFLLTGQSQEKE